LIPGNSIAVLTNVIWASIVRTARIIFYSKKGKRQRQTDMRNRPGTLVKEEKKGFGRYTFQQRGIFSGKGNYRFNKSI